MRPATPPYRQSLRLPGFDYGQTASYFVTICTRSRVPLFGTIQSQTVRLSDLGRIVAEAWLQTSELRPEVSLDAFIVMPDHLHGIISIDGERNRPRGENGYARRGSRVLGSIIAGFKSTCTLRINLYRQTPKKAVWQRNYFEHIIRSVEELQRVRRYIAENPLRSSLGETDYGA